MDCSITNPIARALVEHTIPQGALSSEYNNPPEPLSKALLERGKERYDIYCAACHGLSGFGNGVIVERGFSKPPSFHQERLRNESPKYFVNIILNGIGQMYGYSDILNQQDSWAITRYIQALQLSQYAHLKILPEALQKNILREITP